MNNGVKTVKGWREILVSGKRKKGRINEKCFGEFGYSREQQFTGYFDNG
jgi:hypothetical protein